MSGMATAWHAREHHADGHDARQKQRLVLGRMMPLCVMMRAEDEDEKERLQEGSCKQHG